MFKKTEVKFRGSALVFSLIVMFIVLAAALGVASVSVIEYKSSSATGKSTQAFQVADSAVETVLKMAATDPMGTSLDGLCSAAGCCDSGKVTIIDSVANTKSELTFEDVAGVTIPSCTTTLDQVAAVKAVGTYSGTTRAISAAVAAGTLSWTKIDPLVSNFTDWYGGGVWCAKDARTGITYLKGGMQRGSAWAAPAVITESTVFTLPAVCGAPALLTMFVFNTYNGQQVRLDIENEANGSVVQIVRGTTTTYVADTRIPLDGIWFSGN